MYISHEKSKKTEYNARVIEVEKASFTPLVFSTSGGMGDEATRFYKRLANKISWKNGQKYSDVITFIRRRLRFDLLKTCLISIRGYRGKPAGKPDEMDGLDLHLRPQGPGGLLILTCLHWNYYNVIVILIGPIAHCIIFKAPAGDKVKFLGVIIDEKLTWEPQLEHLKAKLNSSINVIKRIMKFIPESEYHKLYDALFKSHLSYCISCWGGVSINKLESLFSIQKRCVRLLFGKQLNFDHGGFYETCARVRTYQQHIAKKDYQLEHTKPIFNEEKILSLHHLYIQHTFVDLFKIVKYRTPISLYELFTPSPRNTNLLMCLPKINRDISKQNFTFSGSLIWNSVIGLVLNKCSPNDNGIMVPGSSKCSDISAPISIIKNKLKDTLLKTQKLETPGRAKEWLPDNNFKP